MLILAKMAGYPVQISQPITREYWGAGRGGVARVRFSLAQLTFCYNYFASFWPGFLTRKKLSIISTLYT